MPIDIKSLISGGADILTSKSSVGKFVKSTVGLALLLALVMVIIVMFIYPTKENAPFTALGQLFIYAFLTSAIAIFLHDNMIKSDLKAEYRNEAREELVGGVFKQVNTIPTMQMEQPQRGSEYIPVAQSIPITPSVPTDLYIPTAPSIPAAPKISTTEESTATSRWGGSKWGGRPVGSHKHVG